MNMQQLKALVAVVETGSIRAAARSLHLSQSAVTKGMRLLEEDAGVPLLVRGSRGVVLTHAGQRLLARARLVTRQVSLAREELRQIAGDDGGNLHVGLNPFVTLTILGEAYRWFRQRYRNVQIEFIEGLMSRVLPRLRDGTLDMAMVAADVGDLQGDEFHIEHLQRIRQRVVVRKGHPVLQAPTAAALVEYEWIFTRPTAGDLRPCVSAMFALAGVAPPARMVVCEALQAFTLQRNSDAVSLMPEPLLGNPETRDIVAIDNTVLQPFDLELAMLTRPDVPLTPAAEYFAHCILQTRRSAMKE